MRFHRNESLALCFPAQVIANWPKKAGIRKKKSFKFGAENTEMRENILITQILMQIHSLPVWLKTTKTTTKNINIIFLYSFNYFPLLSLSKQQLLKIGLPSWENFLNI